MSVLNQRETYPNQNRRPEQDDYSNGVVLLCFIVIVVLIVLNKLIEVFI